METGSVQALFALTQKTVFLLQQGPIGVEVGKLSHHAAQQPLHSAMLGPLRDLTNFLNF